LMAVSSLIPEWKVTVVQRLSTLVKPVNTSAGI
jgi:hypothetical protein